MPSDSGRNWLEYRRAPVQGEGIESAVQKSAGATANLRLWRPVSNGGGFTPSDMLGLTSWATPIRRIRIQRGPCSLFTHTSNNADGQFGFQKNFANSPLGSLKFSNAFRFGLASANGPLIGFRPQSTGQVEKRNGALPRRPD